jgi:hypothetical protein
MHKGNGEEKKGVVTQSKPFKDWSRDHLDWSWSWSFLKWQKDQSGLDLQILGGATAKFLLVVEQIWDEGEKKGMGEDEKKQGEGGEKKEINEMEREERKKREKERKRDNRTKEQNKIKPNNKYKYKNMYKYKYKIKTEPCKQNTTQAKGSGTYGTCQTKNEGKRLKNFQ